MLVSTAGFKLVLMLLVTGFMLMFPLFYLVLIVFAFFAFPFTFNGAVLWAVVSAMLKAITEI